MILRWFPYRNVAKLLLTSVLAMTFVFTFEGCGGKKKKDVVGSQGVADVMSQDPKSGVADADIPMGADSDSGKAGPLETIHFPFDSSVIKGAALDRLKNNAGWMKENSSVKVQIEGHCDVRGGIQYNLALGERRAKSTISYLTDMGISPDRISFISYGKERLLDLGTTEAAHYRNRRANFVVTSK